MVDENSKFNDIVNRPKYEGDVNFGCVLFDMQDGDNGEQVPRPGAGWASISGHIAFRIKDTDDLSSEVIWITNIDQKEFWKLGLARQTKLKSASYLSTNLLQIMNETGFTVPKMQISKVCENLSSIFNKVMKVASEFYYLNSYLQKDLAQEIRNNIEMPDSLINGYVDEALLRAYQDVVVCKPDFVVEDGDMIVSLKRPRYFHAKQVLETQYPSVDGNWQFMDIQQLTYEAKINSDGDVAAYLISLNKPLIACVELVSYKQVDGIGVNLDELLRFGQTLSVGGRKRDRDWITQPELLYLNHFANLKFGAAYVVDSVIDKSFTTKLPYLGELSNFSYSLGLLAESVWMGLSAREISYETNSKSLVSPRACWIKASDRYWCFESALKIASAGFDVISYGMGAVSLSVSPSELQRLKQIAPLVGLVLPQKLLI